MCSAQGNAGLHLCLRVCGDLFSKEVVPPALQLRRARKRGSAALATGHALHERRVQALFCYLCKYLRKDRQAVSCCAVLPCLQRCKLRGLGSPAVATCSDAAFPLPFRLRLNQLVLRHWTSQYLINAQAHVDD